MTLQFLFFDGEEAFKEWTATDSIYGSRHLAQKWKNVLFSHQGVSGNFLDRIDVFVLLDLLGAKDPTIYSLNPSTHVSEMSSQGKHATSFLTMIIFFVQALYQRLSVMEDSLARLGMTEGGKIFAGTKNSRIQDDHIPFQRNGDYDDDDSISCKMERLNATLYSVGVNILHLIASPFPRVWHTMGDNARVVHLPTVEKLNKIFRSFVAEYLELK